MSAWTAERQLRLRTMWGEDADAQVIADTLRTSRGAVYREARKLDLAERPRRKTASERYAYGGPLRRFESIKPKGHRIHLADDHPSVRFGRTLFPSRVEHPDDRPRLLIDGHNSRKIGKTVMKGKLKGFPIFTLTLEERATCPRTCLEWKTCYGNSMNWARRIKHGRAFEERLWEELAEKQAKHPNGFLVRLHILGDFYSVDYAELWADIAPSSRRRSAAPALGLPCELDEVATHRLDGKPLRDHQRHIIRWGVEGGRRAYFLDFGLGKSTIQVETGRIILEKAARAKLATVHGPDRRARSAAERHDRRRGAARRRPAFRAQHG
jgi:hypothetical protein